MMAEEVREAPSLVAPMLEKSDLTITFPLNPSLQSSSSINISVHYLDGAS